jgi:hypothetical protein
MRVIGGGGSQSSQTTQSAQRVRPDYGQWVTKAVAASRLDVSTKTIEGWDKDGTLRGTLYRRPTGGPRIRVYNPAAIATLAAERRLGRPVTVLAPGSLEDAAPAAVGAESEALVVAPAGEFDQQRAAAGALAALVEALAVLRSVKAASETSQTLVLTLEQAAAVSGWSVGFLRRARAQGRLPADRDRWRGADGRWHVGWKIRRTDLKAL